MIDLLLTRNEADQLDADGRVVLFRAGEQYDVSQYPAGDTAIYPPAEFVEAAHPCETCGGKHPGPTVTSSEHWNCIEFRTVTILCLDGKRRVAAVVPCENREWIGGSEPVCPTCGGGGLVTVGHIIVEWGPLVVIGQADEPRPIQGAFERSFITLRYYMERPVLVRFVAGQRGEGEVLTLPPDIDTQSLVGQCALGIRKVTS